MGYEDFPRVGLIPEPNNREQPATMFKLDPVSLGTGNEVYQVTGIEADPLNPKLSEPTSEPVSLRKPGDSEENKDAA